MLTRRLQGKLDLLLDQNPAVALVGPRQVGKTTLAHQIAESRPSIYLDLETPQDLAKISDINLFFAANRDRLIILDEVQRAPNIFAPLRGIIDAERRRGNRTGLFLFLGSASIDLLRQSSESLAGRISYAELGPLSVLEMQTGESDSENEARLRTLWVRGGFPESVLKPSDRQSLAWRTDFIRTYLERDIPQLGPRIPAETLRRFWTMLAHSQGGLFNAARLGTSLGISGQSVGRYLDLLVDLLLVRRLSAWTLNPGKRLVKSPKVYVRDSGIVHALLGLEHYNDLLGHPVVGGSWEGFVLENLLEEAPALAMPHFYRSAGGAEIDLILELRPDRLWAVEIKRTLSPSISKGFRVAFRELQPERGFVVYPGPDSYPLSDKVWATPLTHLMRQLSSLK